MPLPWLLMMLESLAYPVLAVLALALFSTVWGAAHGWGWLKILLTLPLCGLLVLAAALALGLALPTRAPLRPAEVALRIAHLNALYYNHGSTTAREDFILESHADALSLVEVNPELRLAAAQLKALYPYQLFSGTDDAMGGHLPMLLLSRYPAEAVLNWGARHQLYRIHHPRGTFHLLQSHPQSPYLPMAHAYRNSELAYLATLSLPAPLVMVGDFNATPWDKALAPLRHKHTLAGSWWPTYPSPLPLTPIDLLFTSGLPAPALHRVRVPGTDHLALIADFREY